MIDLDSVPTETLLARGEYATVRSAHEDVKKKLAILCGQFSAVAPQILRHMQPDNDDTPDMGAVLGLIALARETLDKIDACVDEIESLARQRADLKPLAWGKGK